MIMLLGVLAPLMLASPVPAALATQVVPAAVLADVSNVWARRFATDANHGAVLAYPVSDQCVPAGRVTVRGSDHPTITTTYASYPIDIFVDKRLVRTVYAGYRVVQYVYAPVLRAAQRAGHLLEAGDFLRERVASDGSRVPQLDELTGRKLNVAQNAGTMVRVDETSTDQIVRAGTPVVLIVRDGSVALAADVIARTSGGLGEMVTVYDEHARHMLSGIVTAPARVELTLQEIDGT